MLLDEGVFGEPRRYRRVLDSLHFHGVRGPIAFELGYHQSAIGAKAEHVQAVALTSATKRLPTVKLEGDNQNAIAKDLWMRNNPLLQIRALPQTGLREPDRLRRACSRSGHGEDSLAHCSQLLVIIPTEPRRNHYRVVRR